MRSDALIQLLHGSGRINTFRVKKGVDFLIAKFKFPPNPVCNALWKRICCATPDSCCYSRQAFASTLCNPYVLYTSPCYTENEDGFRYNDLYCFWCLTPRLAPGPPLEIPSSMQDRRKISSLNNLPEKRHCFSVVIFHLNRTSHRSGHHCPVSNMSI